ncbi:MAG: DNA polymerase I [Ignavibacteriae bacterium]|nr:DNA polymerase I [Ignavibacteriota bacterium]
MAEKLFLIDAMATIYRAYFAMISRPLTNKDGKNTSAVYGFLNTLLKIIDDEKPDHIAVCFDTEKPTFRHKEFPQYKAQRQEIPDDMPWQIGKVKELVTAMNIPMIEMPGFEADDIIGTLVKQAEKEKVISYMVTPDKDYMQLISGLTYMYKPSRNISGGKYSDFEVVSFEGVNEKFGVTPDKVIEVLGLMGDASDNIPGVKGVGEKTATALIQEFGSIDNIYANIGKVTKTKLKENLLTYKKDAFLAKRLVTIKTDVPLKINFHDLIRKDVRFQELVSLLEELEFKSFIKKFSSAKQEPIPDGPAKIDKALIPEELEPEEPAEDMKITIKGMKLDDVKVNIPENEIKLLTIKDVQHKYYTIKNNKDYERLMKKLMEEELISFDTETTGLDVFADKLVGMSFAYQEKEAFYVPVFGEYKTDKKDSGDLFSSSVEEKIEKIGVEISFAIEKLKPVLENKKIRKVGHNLKYDYMVMKNYGIEIANIFFDSMVASYILSPGLGEFHNMDAASERYLNYTPVHIEELIGKGKDQKSMADVDVDVITEYAAEDADVSLQLFHRLKYELQKINLYKLCTDIEFPLVQVLADMELEGIRVDDKMLKVLDKEIIGIIKQCEDKIYKIAEEKFNINSTQQLAKILFTKLKLVPSKKTKTGYSTDVSVLEELKSQHEIAQILLDYRMLTKLKSTYIEGLLEAINPKTKRVHTSFNQILTSTGRLSSVNPNLQNIPIRSEVGRNLRKAFVPAYDEFSIMSADYSQVELRIMAHVSEDENFINAFKKGRDIHTETAMRVFGIENKKDVTQGMRRKAKEVNFGIIYGIGAFGLANRLEIRNSEARDIIDRYFREYPKVKEYMENTKKFARQNGFVQTLMGRRRYLPQINNQNPTVRAEDERAAINMPIQGTAADMIKIAMINIYEDFRKNKYKSKMLLQVHDELVFEVDKRESEDVKKCVIRNMKNAIKLNVPIEVEVGEGRNWFDAH